MRIVCNRDKLHDALQVVSSVIPGRHTRTILQNVKIELQGDMLELVATDLEVGIRHVLEPDQVDDPETVVLPGQTLAGIVREVRDEEVTLETSKGKAVIKAGRSRFSLVLAEGEEFPEVPRFEEGDKSEEVAEIPCLDLVELISKVVFSVATEQSRYAINGVYFKIGGKSVEMVATDGRRLARRVCKLKKATKLKAELIIPPKMLREVEKRAVALEDGVVRIATSDNQILAQIGPTTLVGRLVEGNYPRYQDVIPKDAKRKVIIRRDEFAAKLRQAQLLISEETMSVLLRFSPGLLRIESRAPERGEANVEMDVDYDGEEITVSFNPTYIADVLKVLSGEQVSLELSDSQRPGVMREGDDYVYVIMPVTSKS